MYFISYHKRTIISGILLLLSAIAFGQKAPAQEAQNSVTIDTNFLLLLVAIFLLIPIVMLSNIFMTVAKRYYSEKSKSGILKILFPLSLLLTSTSLFAQETTTFVNSGLLKDPMTLLLLGVIGFEILLIIFFSQKTNDFIRKIETTGSGDTKESGQIRETDNIFPVWFTSIFIIILLSVIGYLFKPHLVKLTSGYNEQQEEPDTLASQNKANVIDENNVGLMTGADIEAGKQTFKTTCAICHKSNGSGLVGPNLCDDYWIHGGSLNDIFKTIKNGYPGNGMASWKDQLTPLQIAQVANFILTLKGTNPPGAKAKQGTLYVSDVKTADSSSANNIKTDTSSAK